MPGDKKSKLRTIGANVAPSLLSGALSTLFSSHPLTAPIPAFGAVAVRAAIDLMAQRRMEAATSSTRVGIALRLQRGDSPRADLLDTDSGSPLIDELFEGAVRAAQDDFEARKAEHYGTFVVNFIFTSDVSGADARTLLRIAERLNWRQWLILEWIRRGECAPLQRNDKPSRTAARAAARQDFQELDDGDLVQLNDGAAGDKTLTLTDLGDSIATLLGLGALDIAEIREMVTDVAEAIRANPPKVYMTAG